MIYDWVQIGYTNLSLGSVFSQIKQDLEQRFAKVELLKFTTSKNCILCPFVDTNSYLTTKSYNFYIKCQSNSERKTKQVFVFGFLKFY